ncbi:hypothetical protein FOS14_19560 [Skermania sp. ID1734]|uniref:relaxase/mobilization nuclease domain-containing protein n=1 Tax=Skermania sp. ID1734 TaxID=2597516 RepID=UPI00117FE1A9|nr:hypothetical protein [Skermania sp. ID1734]TSD94841.1 hypothetical protein FOS14_19560 [Skermania sp. ID1734]
MAGLIYYLQGPGKHNEHTSPHVVAGSGPLDRFTWPAPDGGVQILTRVDAATISAELDEPHQIHGTAVPWIDPGKKRAALEQAANMLPGMATKAEKERWARDQARVADANVWQCALSLHSAEGVLSDEQWSAIARDFMREMGFDTESDAPARWVAIRHGLSSNGNDHIHVAASLVREDGSLVNLWPKDPATGKAVGDGPRSSLAIQALERKYGLRIDRDEGATNPSYHHAEVSTAERDHGRSEPVRAELMRRVRAYSTAADSEAAFVERLATDSRLVLRPRFEDGQVKGYSVALVPSGTTRTEHIAAGAPVWYSGTSLGRDLSLGELRRSWGESVEGIATARRRWRAVADNPERAAREFADAPVGGAGSVDAAASSSAKLPYQRPVSSTAPNPGREVRDPRLDRARTDLAGWTSYVRALPAGDPEQLGRATAMTAGVFAAWSIQVEDTTPGPLSRACNVLSRSATRKYSGPRPRARRNASPSAATAILLLTSTHVDEAIVWTVLMQQILAAVDALAEAHAASDRAATAARLTSLRAEMVDELRQRVGATAVPAEASRRWHGDVDVTPVRAEQSSAGPVTPDEILHPKSKSKHGTAAKLPYRRPEGPRTDGHER